MSTDPRIEAAAAALLTFETTTLPLDEVPGPRRRDMIRRATAALAAADNAATKTFTGAQVNKAGWVCGACEPGDYTKCDDCQSACDDVAQFVNRLIGGTA